MAVESPELSVIVPLFNEEESVGPLYQAIIAGVEGLGKNFEILFVDDGSRDRTFEVCRQLAARDPRLRLVKFRRNYGQTPAMAAGIDCARGKVLVTMDGDLQNDPGDIPAFMAKIEEGYDLVAGIRVRRQDKWLTRKLPSMIANRIIARVTGVPIRDNGCSLKAYRAEVIQRIPLYSEMHRFIPAMASMAGIRLCQIPVRHHARAFGSSKYGLSRIYRVILDLLVIKTLVSYATRPLLWFVMIGSLAGMASLAFTARALWGLWTLPQESSSVFAGAAAIFAALAISGLVFGFLGELIYRSGHFDVEALSELTLSKTGFQSAEIGGTRGAEA